MDEAEGGGGEIVSFFLYKGNAREKKKYLRVVGFLLDSDDIYFTVVFRCIVQHVCVSADSLRFVCVCVHVCGLTAGPEPLSRAAVRAGLRAGVTGAAGGTGASAAAVTGRSGNQFLHSLPQQPGLRYTVEPTHVTVQKSQR